MAILKLFLTPATGNQLLRVFLFKTLLKSIMN